MIRSLISSGVAASFWSEAALTTTSIRETRYRGVSSSAWLSLQRAVSA